MSSLKVFLHRHWFVLVSAVIVCFSAWLFTYRLDWTPLSSWDEAWYASITRSVYGDTQKLRGALETVFNHTPFYDHPPFGFWIGSLFFFFGGMTDTMARGIGWGAGILHTLALIALGRTWFRKTWLALVPVAVVHTSVWYVMRARSGNLDVLLATCITLAMFAAYRTKQSLGWFILLSIALVGCVLTKTLVGIPIACFIYGISIFRNFNKRSIPAHVITLLLFVCLAMPWYLFQYAKYGDAFIHRHLYTIGTRGAHEAVDLVQNMYKNGYLFHMGVLKWYYPMILCAGALVLARTRKDWWRNMVVVVWFCLLFFPFIRSAQTELWHLIPAYIPASYILAAGIEALLSRIPHMLTRLGLICAIGCFTIIVYLNIRHVVPAAIPQSYYVRDEVATLQYMNTLQTPIYIDDDFLPMAVWYTNRHVYKIQDTSVTLLQHMQNKVYPSVPILTRTWVLGQLDERDIPYKILYKTNQYVCIQQVL